MKYEMEGKTLYIELPEQFDHHNSIHLVEDINQFLQVYQFDTLVFDFTNTKFMDSSGIGILLGRYKRMKLLGGKVYVQGVNERIQHMMEIAGLVGFIKKWEETD